MRRPPSTIRRAFRNASIDRKRLSPGALDRIAARLSTRSLTAMALAGERFGPIRTLRADRLSSLAHFALDGPASVADVDPLAVKIVELRTLSTKQFDEVTRLFPNAVRVSATLLTVIIDNAPWHPPPFSVHFEHAMVFDRSSSPASSEALAWAKAHVAPRSARAVTLCVDVPELHALRPPPWDGPFACAALVPQDRQVDAVREFLARHEDGPVVLALERKYGLSEYESHLEYEDMANELRASLKRRPRRAIVTLDPFSHMDAVLDMFSELGPNVMVVSEGVCLTRDAGDAAARRGAIGFDYEARYRGDVDLTPERTLFCAFDPAFAARAAAFVGVHPRVFLVDVHERHRDSDVAAAVMERLELAEHVLAGHDVTRATVVALARRAVLEPCPTDALAACRKVHRLFNVFAEFMTYYPMRRPSSACKDAHELELLNWCAAMSPAGTFADVRGNFVFGFIKARMFRTARRIVDLGAPAATVFDGYTVKLLDRNDADQRAFMLDLLEMAERELERSGKPRPMEFDRVRTTFLPERAYAAAAFDMYMPVPCP